MGAEESSLYPASERSSARGGSNSATATTQNGPRRRPQPKKVAPVLVPQAVLLVGYTPDGNPILMSNPSQNSIAHLTQTNQHQSPGMPPVIDTQSPLNTTLSTLGQPTLQTSPFLMSEDSNMAAFNTIVQAPAPVMAVPRTILGPDGKAYTALVKPSAVSDVGSQVVERGIVSSGGTYQTVREPGGRLVRHIFHEPKPNNPTTTLKKTAHVPPPVNTTIPLANSSPASDNFTAPIPTATSTSSNLDSIVMPKRNSLSSESSKSASPSHPTVLSTADFLRANSSLDTSYAPSPNESVSRHSLVQYVTWDSDIAKSSPLETTAGSSSTQHSTRSTVLTTEANPTSNPPPLAPPPSYPSLSTSSSKDSSTSSTATSHKPSKALAQHLAHGGDKHLIDVHNPYEDL